VAKTILNSALGRLRGRVDGWVYRNQNGALVVAKRPDFSAVVPSPAQIAVRERFLRAAAFGRRALTEAPLREIYGRDGGTRVYARAMTDALTPPRIDAIDTSAYTGSVGQPIVIRAGDDFEVTAVTVVLRDDTGTALESGAAILTDGAWVYTPTTSVAAGTTVAVEATAADRPGNRTSESVTVGV
jgi:hypothetical protein